MFSATQQVLKNRRRMSILATLQREIADRKSYQDEFAVVKEQKIRLHNFLEELQVEEDKIQSKICEIGENINKLEQAIKGDKDTPKN
ncbi:uncharacterized protein LOC128868024 [Anastrepha ludens]|uniref:uncharacterized protein LOC128868024 n=1 Tax=Anastrepha ludens TaxID=28586 RepID=UPI0023AF4E7E|nr:uncharacterized protein LOC128868024 [Anastrepha ludens]